MSEESNEMDLEVNLQNPYAYLERTNFTSEKYKIEIRGLPKYYGIKEFKKLLNEKLNLDLCKIKPPKRGSCWVFVCFKNEAARDAAISTIDGLSWKNCTLSARKAKAAPDPYIKRKMEAKEAREANEENSQSIKSNENNSAIPVADRVKSSTTPLWNIPYQKQLEMKHKEIKSILQRAGDRIFKENSSLTKFLEKKRAENDGLICELKPILSSDTIEGYRNKCEFTIGKNQTGDDVVIGFRLSSYAAGSTTVGPVDDLCHIPDNMKVAVKLFEQFVRDSKLDVYNPVDHSGHWRQLVARTTRSNHLMLIVGFYPQNLSPDTLTELKLKIREFFETGSGKEARVTSLYFENMGPNSHQAGGDLLDHLSGSTYIEELLFDLRFRISPQAFFQINTAGAEILYQAAIDLAQCGAEDISLLDVCCGTGTIGLCFAKHCDEVLGIEMIGDAVKDAKENARINNISNCEFFTGKAENIMKAVIHRATKSNIIAIVDPPRAGLHQQALLALRRTKNLKKIIYISCDPKAAVKNLIDLARPTSKQYIGQPLVPVTAIPVDMFPHTNHCELVILLERIENPAGNE